MLDSGRLMIERIYLAHWGYESDQYDSGYTYIDEEQAILGPADIPAYRRPQMSR